MTNVKDVKAHPFILEVAKDLKDNLGVKMPEFAVFVKTGSHVERSPDNPDWWFIRMASILRKVYISGNVDVNSLRSYYGGKKNRGVRPSRFRRAGGKIIRVCLQDLGKLGFVKIDEEKSGRVITPKGQGYLDKIATSLDISTKKEISKAKVEIPKVEVPKAKIEIPKVEVPKAKVEIPKVEVPKAKVETPKVEVPKAKVETPKVEVPKAKVETPKAEVPKVKIETPKVEVPKAKVETPKETPKEEPKEKKE